MSPPRPAAHSGAAWELAAALPPLLVAAERVAATVAQGVHGRRRTGQGETFWQFRRYQADDPAQAIDWRQSARSQPLFVREHEWEAAESVWLWADASPSMAWRSHPSLPWKRERAALLVLALAALLVQGGEQVALLGEGGPGRGGLVRGRAGLERLSLALAGSSSAGSSSAGSSSAGSSSAGASAAEGEPSSLPPEARLPRFARLVLAGDFLAEPDSLARRLMAYGERGIRGHLLQVLDPAEESLPYRGRVRFSGLEGEGTVLAENAESLREAYRRRLAAQRATLADLAARAGWTFATHRTDHPPQAALLGLYQALSGREGRR